MSDQTITPCPVCETVPEQIEGTLYIRVDCGHVAGGKFYPSEWSELCRKWIALAEACIPEDWSIK